MSSSNNELGLYVMQVAALMTGMHPQTLRKYERAGFLKPSRRSNVRLYSNEEIERLMMIKHLVNDMKLNLAGIELVLKLRDRLLEIRDDISSFDIDHRLEKRLISLIDSVLDIINNPE